MTIPEKADYYAAATVRAIFTSQGAKASKNISDYLLDFSFAKATEKQPEDAADSRSIWLNALGVQQEQ